MIVIAVLIFVAPLVAYAAFTYPVMLQFRSYCERVAKATDRIKELKDQRGVDDGGNNAFEREQWRKLLEGEFGELKDPSLIAEATTLSSKVRLSLFLGVGWLIALGVIAALCL